MPTIGLTGRPSYMYDLATDTWVPIGVPDHTHTNYATLPSQTGNAGRILQTNGSTLSWVPQVTTDNVELLSIAGAY